MDDTSDDSVRERDVPAMTVRSLLAVATTLPAFVGGFVLFVSYRMGISVVPAIAAAMFAALAAGYLLVRSIAAPIDQAVDLAHRFDAGETEVRLDPPKGIPQFRLLARILNRIADQIVDRDMCYEMVSKATGDAVWDWDRTNDRVRWRGQLQSVFGMKADRFEAPLDWWRNRIHPEGPGAGEREPRRHPDGEHRALVMRIPLPARRRELPVVLGPCGHGHG